jgi:hypothetical protein
MPIKLNRRRIETIIAVLVASRRRPSASPCARRPRYLISIGQDDARRVYLVTERGPMNKGKPSLGAVYRLVPRRNEIS